MTTRRRRHPAQASRVLAAGLATASMMGMGASMALGTPTPSTAVADTAAPAPTTVIIRRTVQAPSADAALRAATPSASGAVTQPRSTTRGS